KEIQALINQTKATGAQGEQVAAVMNGQNYETPDGAKQAQAVLLAALVKAGGHTTDVGAVDKDNHPLKPDGSPDPTKTVITGGDGKPKVVETTTGKEIDPKTGQPKASTPDEAKNRAAIAELKKASAALDAAIAAEPDANRKALIEEKRGRGDLQTEKAAQDWLAGDALKKDVEFLAGLKGIKQATDAVNKEWVDTRQLDADVHGVAGLDARVMRGKPQADDLGAIEALVKAQKPIQEAINADKEAQADANLLARLNRRDYADKGAFDKDLPVQKEIQALINQTKATGAQGEQVAAVMNGQNYETPDGAKQAQAVLTKQLKTPGVTVVTTPAGPLVVNDQQQPLDGNGAPKPGQTVIDTPKGPELVNAKGEPLGPDGKPKPDAKPEEIADNLATLASIAAGEAQQDKARALDAAVKADPTLGERLARHNTAKPVVGADLATTDQSVNEYLSREAVQKDIQGYVNGLPKSSEVEKKVVAVMNGRDYVDVDAAKADQQVLSKQLKTPGAEVVQAPVDPNGKLHGGVRGQRTDAPHSLASLQPKLTALYRAAAGAVPTADDDADGGIDFVNNERMIVDRDGRLKPVPHVRTAQGGAVYRRDDGRLTTDIHGGPLPAGVVLVNEAGMQVDASGRPLGVAGEWKGQ
ncbi:hypothetical protein, partial [Burkholderia sp. LS-044]|uniref:hypothetical protein n=1 Tax=Burkholderia sp. LS-044 TaxID=1459967 RepID=UPI001B3C0D28